MSCMHGVSAWRYPPVLARTTSLVGSTGAGVEIREIRRVVDEFLAKQFLQAGADSGRYEAQADLYERLEAVLGAPEESSTITGRLDQLFAGIGTLPIEPDSTIRRTSALTDIKTWADEVSRLSNQIQQLRQLVQLGLRRSGQFGRLSGQIGLLRIGLGADRDIFAKIGRAHV